MGIMVKSQQLIKKFRIPRILQLSSCPLGGRSRTFLLMHCTSHSMPSATPSPVKPDVGRTIHSRLPMCSTLSWKMGLTSRTPIHSRKNEITHFIASNIGLMTKPAQDLKSMDYVKHGKIQGCSMVFIKAHCLCILPCLT